MTDAERSSVQWSTVGLIVCALALSFLVGFAYSGFTHGHESPATNLDDLPTEMAVCVRVAQSSSSEVTPLLEELGFATAAPGLPRRDRVELACAADPDGSVVVFIYDLINGTTVAMTNQRARPSTLGSGFVELEPPGESGGFVGAVGFDVDAIEWLPVQDIIS